SVHAMMDISDGLAIDLARMATASGCGALVDDVPVAPSATTLAESRKEDAARYAASAGEDFELLVAIAPRAFSYLSGQFKKRFGQPLLRVGTFRRTAGVAIKTAGGEAALTGGWDHLTR
ncbi:MAG: hypothetical protein JOZ59_01630, partial [Candidatus Eremiobacteraeota bacterium]|nr:hypothetical protein [Candidatus Eremiobacteraeota bacterium]